MSIPYVRANTRRDSNTDRSKYSQWYADTRWRRMSKAFLMEFPFCLYCLTEGKVNRGAEDYPSDKMRSLVVDHIVPHRGDLNKFWDESGDGLETLCRTPCHDRHKQAADRAGADWIQVLRARMKEHNSYDHVHTYQEWIPPALYARLMEGHRVEGG